MSVNPKHFCLAIPDGHQGAINAAGQAIGYGPTNFSVLLVSPPDGETVTHYGCCFPGSLGFQALAEAAKQGTLPDDVNWSEFGATLEQVTAAFAAMLMSVKEREEIQPNAHFAAFLEDNGLAILETETP
ncbi:hypothetical protein [Oricola indica]|uniref:hypothetical protein n=1 Tax=Oricola indica TaxID=2872591 RepID=UPI003CCB8115